MSSKIREENEQEFDRFSQTDSDYWRYARHDRKRIIDQWVVWDVRPAIATIHKGRYLGPTDTEARVRTAIDAARTALRELSEALHADRARRTRQWKAEHDDR